MLDVLVLLQVVGLGHRGVEDRLRRRDGRDAAPEHGDVQRVEAGRLQAKLRGDLAGGVHLRDARREQQAGLAKRRAPFLLERDHPVLLAGGVRVVAPGSQAGLHDLAAELGERPDHVADDLGALEQFGQRVDRVLDLDDLVVGGLDAGDFRLHRGVQLLGAAAGGDERDVVLAQVFADQPAGVAGDAVDDDGFLLSSLTILRNACCCVCAYMPMPPSTGRPMPVMKRASSEHRNTTASAMSPTSARRPSGVCSTTEPTAASTSAARPSATMSPASCMPMSVAIRPGIDAVDAHAVAELAGFHGGDPRHAVDRRFGARVDRDRRERDGRGDRRDVDDRAALAGRAAWAHRAECVLHAERGADDVDVAHPARVLGLDLADQRGDLDAGIVDQDVEAAERLDGRGDGLLPLRVVGDVQLDEAGFDAADRRALARWRVPASSRTSPIITPRRPRASACAMPAPMPPRATGDQGFPAFKALPTHDVLLRCW